MAVFRKVNISFWQDDKVIDDFTPEDKFFMLYLMTNPYTNQIGCYHITIKQMEFETGYNKETILKLINRFEKILKVIKYSEETKEMLILNWHKYNWSSSPKVLACMLKEYKSIKNKGFRYSIDTLFKQYEYSIYTQTQEEEEEEEEEEEKEEEKEEEIKKNKKFVPPTIDEVIQYCQERNNNVNARQFFDYYSVADWRDKKGKQIKNWKQKIIAVWEKQNQEQKVIKWDY